MNGRRFPGAGSGQRRSLQMHIPTTLPKARQTGNPRLPTSKYRFSRCWKGRCGSYPAWPGRWTFRYLPTIRPLAPTRGRGEATACRLTERRPRDRHRGRPVLAAVDSGA